MKDKHDQNDNYIIQKLSIITVCLAVLYATLRVVAKNMEENSSIEEGNVYLKNTSVSKNSVNMYESIVKPILDRTLAFGGLIFLAPLYAVIAVAIYIDDPGPVFFTQKRIGKDKHFFMLHKYRSMKISTPHDVPTHQLSDPEQYITRVGKVLRKTSLDELPQIWDIFRGHMSIIGPRPALWNQADLIEEREKYGVNEILPGLTGLAQIKGRDELEISDKAKIDGKYTAILKKGGWKAFFQDIRCFFGTIVSVMVHDGVVEGGTGKTHMLLNTNNNFETTRTNVQKSVEVSDSGFSEYAYHKKFIINKSEKKRVLITGAGSYIGESLKKYAKEHYPNLIIDTIDMVDRNWKKKDFSSYDAVFHVAGMAHTDVGKVSEERKKQYYAINTDLAIETAENAKAAGVSQFIFISSMIVYGDSAPYGRLKIIDEHTIPSPINFYGDSKWQADIGVRELADNKFRVAVLRTPMVYGKGARGNYQVLSKWAKYLPFFPDVDNRRSMLYIDNLCELVCQLICSGEGGIYFPQNKEYVKTADMVRRIGAVYGHSVKTVKLFNSAVKNVSHGSGKISQLVNKIFGNFIYSHHLSSYEGLDYQVVGWQESIVCAEGRISEKGPLFVPSIGELSDYSVLMAVYKNDVTEYVKLAIDSMMVQTFPCEQFVIVVDGPISESLANLIDGYKLLHPELFTIVKIDNNGGLGNALNQGIKQCRNELIARMDADDISVPERCEKQVKAFQKNPKLSILGGQIDEFIDNPYKVVSTRITPVTYEEIQKFAKRRSPFNHVSVMYRKSIIDKLGGYETYRRKEDLELFVRAVHEGCYSENLKDTLVKVRVGNGALERRKDWKNCKEYIDIMKKFYDKGYIGVKDMAFVFFGQMSMVVLPSGIVSLLSKKFLRKDKSVV